MLGRRMLALAIDGVVILATFVIIGTSFVTPELTAYVLGQNLPTRLLGFAVIPLLEYIVIYPAGLIYFTLLEGRFGKSVGKKMVGIKVERADRKPVGYKTIFLKRVFDVIDCLPVLWLIGGVSILADDDNRRLGDRVAGTIVVQDIGDTYGDLLS